MFETLPDLVAGLRDADDAHGLTLVDPGGRETAMSWRDLHARTLARARRFDALGVRAGDRVLLCLTNEAAVIEGFLALLHLGAIPVSVAGPAAGQDPAIRARFLSDLVRLSRARWIVEQPETDRGAAVDEGRRDGAALPLDTRDSLVDEAAVPAGRATADDLALVQFSSGSTSQPKGIRLTHRNLRENVRLVIEAAARHSEESLATWLPLSHDMGLVGTLLATLAVRPRRLVLMHPMRFLLRPIHWLDALSRTGARVSACPNFALDLCVERVRDEQLRDRAVDLSGLEVLMVGAETVQPESVRRFEKRFAPWGLGGGVLQPVYGLAEATLIVSAPSPGSALRTRRIDGQDVVSVGRPLGDFEVRIATEAGTTAAPLTSGEILLRGACVTPGYLDGEDTAAPFRNGWLATGDLGTLDEEGHLYVTGRIKDLLIVDGRNHHAQDICAALANLPFLRPTGVHAFAVPVAGGQRVVVLAAGRADALPESERVDRIKRRVLAHCGLAVDDVLFVPRIPRTSSGKVERHACAALYQERARG